VSQLFLKLARNSSSRLVKIDMGTPWWLGPNAEAERHIARALDISHYFFCIPAKCQPL
jgi:hypothetical protein